MEIDVAAHHHGGQLRRGGVFRIDGADVLALAEHGAAVRHRHDLRQLVRDKEDGLPLRRQILHDLHQLVDLLRRQHGGGLVEDQDLIVPVQHFQDLGALLHTHGDVLDQSVRVHMETVLLAEGQHLFPGLLFLEKAMLRRLHAHDDVVQHRKAVHQLEVLVHHADPQVIGVIGVLDRDLLAVLLDRALLRLIQAEQHAHQRGLARAVFAQQGMDLTLFQLKGNVIIGDDAWEPLRNVEHFDGVIRFQVKPPSFRFNGPPCGSRGDGNHVHLPAAAYCPHIQYYVQYTITPLKKKGKSTAGIIFLKSGLLRALPSGNSSAFRKLFPKRLPAAPTSEMPHSTRVPMVFHTSFFWRIKKERPFGRSFSRMDLRSALSP